MSTIVQYSEARPERRYASPKHGTFKLVQKRSNNLTIKY